MVSLDRISQVVQMPLSAEDTDPNVITNVCSNETVSATNAYHTAMSG